MTTVSLSRAAEPFDAVETAIDLLGGIKKLLRPGAKILIKPNLVFALQSSTGFTTDPRIVESLIELCEDSGSSRIVVAEGSGGTDTQLAFEKCRYVPLQERHDIDLVDLNRATTVNVDVPGGRYLRRISLPRILLESDLIINVPKLKLYRSGRWASICIKNLLGLVPDTGQYSDQPFEDEFYVELSAEFWVPGGKLFLPHHRRWWRPSGEKRKIHGNLSEGLVDLNRVVQPALNVVDAFEVNTDIDMRVAKGESGFTLGAVIAGCDPLAVDCIATRIAGIDPMRVPYLKRAAVRGIGESILDRIRLVGTPLRDLAERWRSAQHYSASRPASRT